MGIANYFIPSFHGLLSDVIFEKMPCLSCLYALLVKNTLKFIFSAEKINFNVFFTNKAYKHDKQGIFSKITSLNSP